METNPKISIIVPAYNVEEYVSQCIESVVNQTYPNWELLLIVGGQDRTPEICDGYAAKDSRIKSIHDNKGLAPARNVGFENVSGDWMMYLDGDDWIDTDTCEKLVKILADNTSVDIVFWKFVQELGSKTVKGKMEWKCPDYMKLYEGEDCKILAKNVLVYSSGIATAYCKLINTDYARKFGICHDRRLKQGMEGVEFSLRAFYHARKAMFVNEYFNHYRFNENSISKKPNEKNTQHITECVKVIEEDIKGFEDNGAYTKALYQRVVYVLMAMAMNTYFNPANKESVIVKTRKFNNVVNGFALYRDSVRKASTENMDKLRKVTLFFMRNKMTFMLHFIAWAKYFLLKKGYFKY